MPIHHTTLAPSEGLSATGARPIDVTFIDSTGIGVLVELRNTAHATGKRVVLHRPSQRVLEVLHLVALDTFFITEPPA